ncbi:MAG TPA: pyridoxamine 5'-phosphate oxidase family protein [Terriglobales bacterium]|nr:pyridoxamine 5'-phosphate oxidase family protein [Terriglobales bacterium]
MTDGVLAGDEILRRKFGTKDIPVETSLSDEIIRLIESLDFFFIATSNSTGECDSSYRGRGKGVPLVRVLDAKTIIFPHYMGNGTFRSLGNILENPHIGMLFMDLKTGLRIRVNGDAEISDDAGWLKMFPNSIETVKVTVNEAYKQNRPAAESKHS